MFKFNGKIKAGDMVRFNSPLNDECYGHGQPVLVLSVSDSWGWGGQIVTVKCWEAFLLLEEKPFMKNMSFHSTWFEEKK